MATLTASEARSKLYRLIDEAAASHQPILITGKRTNAVLVSEEDWRLYRRRCICSPFPVCGSRSGRMENAGEA